MKTAQFRWFELRSTLCTWNEPIIQGCW